MRLAPRPVFLAGREELLRDLDARLSVGDGPGPRIVVLCGLGGAGKTSVALEYAHRHLGEVGVAWQFAGEDPAVLAAGFGELAAELGARDLLDARDPVASVHAALAALPAGWLLVFDIARTGHRCRRFCRQRGAGGCWSPAGPFGRPARYWRCRSWTGRSPRVSWSTGRRSGPAAARELAVELGGLPLALEQAAAYIQATGGSLAGYLDSFRRRRPEMLARGEPTGYDRRSPPPGRWRSRGWSSPRRARPACCGCWRSAPPRRSRCDCCCNPGPGWPTARPGGGARAGAAAGGRAGGRRCDRGAAPVFAGQPGRERVVLVHRLVQAVTADQMPADLATAWRQAAAAVIEAAIPDDPTPATWPVFAALLPHAQRPSTR